jgi:uncharacterized protein
MLNGHDADINKQVRVLKEIVFSSEVLSGALERARLLGLENYYIGAGFVAQTVWNSLFGMPLTHGIKDIDLVYFDDKNLDEESENLVCIRARELYSDFALEIDVKNQARVHLWYENHFGYPISPYCSLESAIDHWPTTATSIGIRGTGDHDLRIYAPFGLDDLFGKIVRPNKAQITREIYERKVRSWLAKWPELVIVPWDEETDG